MAKKKVAKKKVAKAYGTRTDKGGSIDPYLAKLKGPTREIADALVALVRKTLPSSTAEIKWGMPVFSSANGILCYLRAAPAYVRFGFYDRAALDDPDGVLEGSGQGGHVKLTSPDQIDRKRIAAWLKATAAVRAG